MPFKQIFKQAYTILRTHKFLWGLGLLLIWGNGLNIFSYWSDDQKKSQLSSEEIISHFKSHLGLDLMLVGIAIIVAIVLIVLYFRAKASIIIGVKKIMDKQPADFRKSF